MPFAISTSPRTTPEAFVDDLTTAALAHRAVRHPYLQALATGDVPDLRWALADFAGHYAGYARHFRRYLRTVIEQLDDPCHRDALLDNLAEESGNYDAAELDELATWGIAPEWIVDVPHPALFQRFCVALGVEACAPGHEARVMVRWREQFMQLLGSSPAAAVGALGLATENIVRTTYTSFCRAIARLPELAPRDTVFFPLHAAVDDHHTETLRAIAIDHARDEAGRCELRRGTRAALMLRSSVWNWLHARALNPTTVA